MFFLFKQSVYKRIISLINFMLPCLKYISFNSHFFFIRANFKNNTRRINLTLVVQEINHILNCEYIDSKIKKTTQKIRFSQEIFDINYFAFKFVQK